MLHATRLGLAGGILWGVSLLILTALSLYTGYAAQFLQILTSVYPGYTISTSGIFIGGLYGFIDGFVGFFLLAWLYNKLNA